MCDKKELVIISSNNYNQAWLNATFSLEFSMLWLNVAPPQESCGSPSSSTAMGPSSYPQILPPLSDQKHLENRARPAPSIGRTCLSHLNPMTVPHNKLAIGANVEKSCLC